MIDNALPTSDEGASDATSMPDPVRDAAGEVLRPDLSAEAEAEAETPEAWVLRFLEENQHLVSPPVALPPAPPPAPWDGPVSSWKVPGHLSMPHPGGGYMAMALMSRMMEDLDEVTGGTRAATYAEVDTYLGHALIAEGLVPRTYTADEATYWWKSGGYKVLGASPSDRPSTLPDRDRADGDGMILGDDRSAEAPHLPEAQPLGEANGLVSGPIAPAVLAGERQSAFDAAAPVADDGSNPAGIALSKVSSVSSDESPNWNPFSQMGAQMAAYLARRREKLAKDLENLPSSTVNAFADAMRGPRARDLTPGEYRRVWQAFGGMIDLSNVKIVYGGGYNPDAQAAFELGGNPALTEGNTVYINPEEAKGVPLYYSEDFSKTDDGLERLIHEFHHVLQYQRLGFSKFFYRYGKEEATYGPSLEHGFDRNAVYKYDKRALPFGDETIEGQSEMAGRYAKLRATNKPENRPERRLLEKRLKGTGIYGL